ncbi:MAG: hypothetical protein AAF430_01385 [Myxococcota bacterium]
MAAKKKPATARSLEKSAKAIESAIAKERKSKPTIKALGGIGAALTAIREFCKNWPKVKPILKKAIAFLRKNGQGTIADVLSSLVRFLDAVAKVCKIIP